ncbi:MAG TPA: Ig-like domain-containing protein, partial [Candidatus Udaeobacter sp.]|nr:Ig-like domain-containing protein [Candidatus Udaeobacter sp.]
LLGAILLAAPACDQGGGPNVDPSFRVVFLEPSAGSTNVACSDTIRVTFNHPIDTTAVYDTSRPQYFLAGIQPSALFDSLGVTLSNPETDVNGQPIPGTNRTLNLPFRFAPATNYTFNFDLARNTDGRELETRASTVFQTAAGPPGCP